MRLPNIRRWNANGQHPARGRRGWFAAIALAAIAPLVGVASEYQTTFKFGYVYTRALITGPNGAPIWAEFDEAGEVVHEYGEAIDVLAGAYQLPAATYGEYLATYQTLLNELGPQGKYQTELLTREEYQAQAFGQTHVFEPLPGQPDRVVEVSIQKPALRESTQSVLVRKRESMTTRLEAEQGLVLHESPINLKAPTTLQDDARAVLLDPQGKVLHQSPRNIGYRAAYWRPGDGSEGGVDDDNRGTSRVGEVPWGPIPSARVSSTLPIRSGAATGADGRFSMRYYLPACPGFVFMYDHQLVAEIPYTDFNPRGNRVSTYFAARPVSDVCAGIGFGAAETSLGGQMAQLAAQGITATLALPSGRADIQVDVMILNGQASLRNDDPGFLSGQDDPYADSPGVIPLVENAQRTRYDYAPFDGGANPAGDERVADPVLDFNHKGLLKQLSKEDLENTDLYVFRVSNGQLITSRRGLKAEEYVPYNNRGLFLNNDSARFFYKMAMRGPRFRDYLGGRLDVWQAKTNVSEELRGSAADHLRPGEKIKLIAINRATGYMGGLTAEARNLAKHVRFPETVLRPPNLKVWAQRQFQVQAGRTQGEERKFQIGHEGMGLTSDDIVAVYTEWLDHDGSPLPPALPGYTGRVAQVVDDAGYDRLAALDSASHFEILPGSHLQVIKLKEEDIPRHLYVQVNGEPKERNPNFGVSSGAADEGSLRYRPDRYVPILVPIADEARTRLLVDANVRAKRRVVATYQHAQLVEEAATVAAQVLAAPNPSPQDSEQTISAVQRAKALAGQVQPLLAKASAIRQAAKVAIEKKQVKDPESDPANNPSSILLQVFDLILDVRQLEPDARAVINTYRDLPSAAGGAASMAARLLVALDYALVIEAGDSPEQAAEALKNAEWLKDQGQYGWYYRPEYQVSLLKLKFESLEALTELHKDEQTQQQRNQTSVALGLGALSGGLYEPLPYFNLPPQVLLALGYAERPVTPGAPEPVTFEDLEKILAIQTGESADTATDAALRNLVDRLDPNALLALQLYVNQDAANGLYEYVGLPPVIADVRRVELSRTFLTAGFDAVANATPTAQSSDDYLELPFLLLDRAKVQVRILDGNKQQRAVLVPEGYLNPGEQRFLVTYADLAEHQIESVPGPDFYLELVATVESPEFSQGLTHKVRYPGELDPSLRGRMLGQNVVHDVLIQDGALTLSRGDLGFPGRGPALAFVRSYTNQDAGRDGPLGQGWQHSMHISLQPLGFGLPSDPAVPHNLPQWVADNRGKFFTTDAIPDDPPSLRLVHISNGGLFKKIKVNGQDRWYPQRGNHGRLEEDASGFTFTSKDGTQYRFLRRAFEVTPDAPCNEPGLVGIDDTVYLRVGVDPSAFRLRKRLSPEGIEPELVQWIKDRNGNRMQMEYGDFFDAEEDAHRLADCRAAAARPMRRLTKVTDAVARNFKLNYQIIARRPRLKSIEGPDGSALALRYKVETAPAPAGEPPLETVLLIEVEKNAAAREVYDYAKETLRDAYNLTRADDANGNSTSYAYHGPGQVPADLSQFVEDFSDEDVAKKVHYADGATVRFNFPTPNTREVTDARNNLTKYVLNFWGNPREIQEPLGKTTKMTWSVDDPARDDNVMLSRTDALDRPWKYEYDKQGNVTKETDPTGKATVSAWRPDFSLLTSRMDRNRIPRSWAYDSRGNLVGETDGNGKTTVHLPNATGEREKSTDPRGVVTLYGYDEWGLLSQVKRTNSVNAEGQPGQATTVYVNDIRGRRRSMTDPNGHPYVYAYDDLDRLREEKDPDDNKLVYEFDPAGNKTKEVSKLGLTLVYGYDKRNRVETVARSGQGNVAASRSFSYDANGNLTSETDWKGQGTSHTYDALNRRTTTADRAGQLWQISYADPLGFNRDEIDPRGRTDRYAYDTLDRLSEKTEAVGSTQARSFTFAYDAEGHVLVQHDALGRITGTTYDGEYRITGVVEAEGTDEQRATAYTYDDIGNLETITDALGRITHHFNDGFNRRVKTLDGESPPAGYLAQPAKEFRYGYDANGNLRHLTNPRGFDTEITYDALNRPTARVEPGRTTRYTLYDANGNLKRLLTPRGFPRKWEYDAANRLTLEQHADGGVVRYDYDPNGNRTALTDPRGAVTRYVPDALDRVDDLTQAQGKPEQRKTDYVYDAVGNVTQVIVPRHVNGTAQDVTTQVAYDLLNRATIVTEALGTADERKSEYAYDAMDNRHQVQNPRGVLSQAAYDALDRVRTLTEAAGTNVARSATYDYDLVDNLRLQTDARGTVTETKYDAHYRPVEVIDAQNRSEKRSTRYAYDPADNLIATTDPNGKTTNLTPDPLNRPIVIAYPTAGAGNNIVSREYDEEDNLTAETDEADQVTRFPLYDPDNRLKKVCNDADECTLLDYDQNGNLTRKELPAGNEWSYGYDVLNRLASVTTAAGTTSYAYEPGDGLEQVTDAKQKQVEYHYDAVGRVTALIQKKSGGDLTTHYSYQDKINRTGLKDPLGHEISYSYDPLDRLQRADYPTATHPGVRLHGVTYAYDPNHNLTAVTETKSNGVSAQDSTTQTYDYLNRLSTNVQRGHAVSYAYDPADNVNSVSSPGGATHYAYNARNWMTGISPSPLAGEGGGEGATTYTHYPDGKIQSITRANGTVTEYGYDEADRITGIAHKRGATTFLSLGYTYDANGNRDTETETGEVGTRSLDYDYDAAERLTAVDETDSTAPGPRATQYGLDEVGNRGTERITETILDAQGKPASRTINRSYHYDDTHWLTQIDSDHADDPDQSFTYDANGNTTRITRTTGGTVIEDVLDYDLRDRLVKSARGPPGQLQTLGSYDYDYRNLRIRHADPTRGNIETLYDGDKVLEETQNGLAYTRYRHGLGLDALETAGTTHYVHADSLGTTRVLTQASGATQARYRLDAWGTVTKIEGESPNRQIFTGQEYDRATGLHYFGARYYDPGIGRFITQDSYLGEPDDPRSLHRYAYAYANPTFYIDPNGNFVATDWLANQLNQSSDIQSQYVGSLDAQLGDGFWSDVGVRSKGVGAAITSNLTGLAAMGARGLDVGADMALSSLGDVELFGQNSLQRTTDRGKAVVVAGQATARFLAQDDLPGALKQVGQASVAAASNYVERVSRGDITATSQIGAGFAETLAGGLLTKIAKATRLNPGASVEDAADASRMQGAGKITAESDHGALNAGTPKRVLVEAPPPTALAYVDDGVGAARVAGSVVPPAFDVAAIKAMMKADPDRAYYTIRQAIRNGDLDFSTGRNEAVFWSDKNMSVAQAWATKTGRRTLEQTGGGRILNDLDLFKGLGGARGAKLWNVASNKFATRASGEVHAFSTGAKRFGPYGERTWWRIEKPILLQNDEVTSIVRMKVDGTRAATGTLVK